MMDILLDWVELTVRWLHVVAGIAWIGSSFYFIFLDASLRRYDDMAEGVAGESWQVHGGGFYRMRKYVVAPASMPGELHWFKFEAYTTWLTGFFLLVLIHYLDAEIYLVDRKIMDLSAAQAVALGAGSLIAGWLIYDGLCKSALRRSNAALAAVGIALLVAATWGYAQVFSGRGAYLHTGVLIGTLMAGNVFFCIIPNQKIVVADLIAGRVPDGRLGAAAKQRSLHNNYLALPVVFVMLSSHYPMTFGGQWNWVILSGIFVVGGVVRHFFNLKHAGRGEHLGLWLIAGAIMAGLIVLTMDREPRAPAAEVPAFAVVREIIDRHCTLCHSINPSHQSFDTAPLGIVFDRAEDIRRLTGHIHEQAVATEAMPLGNMTEMTEEERAMLAAWIAGEAEK